jgi:hypothetical protein
MPPTDGLWVWVWNWRNCEGGDASAVAARLNRAGARGAIVKTADGGAWFDQEAPAAAIAQRLRQAGTRCATWQYCYGQDIVGEAQRAIETIALCQPDFHVLDIEDEFASLPDPAGAATQLVGAIRRALPAAPLCYSPLPIIRYHLRLPYRQLTDAGCTMLPQLYWTALRWSPQDTVQVFYSDAQTYELLQNPVAPAYQDAPGAQPTAAELQAFLDLVLARGARGISVWSYEHLDEDGWQRAAQVARALSTVAQGSDPCSTLREQIAAVAAERDRLAATLAQIRALLAS